MLDKENQMKDKVQILADELTQTERKHGGFIVERLSNEDRLLLVFFFLITILDNVAVLYDRPLGPWLSYPVPGILSFCIIFTPMGQRFVRFNYSSIWLIFVLKFAIIDYHILHYSSVCLLPLFCFVEYQVIRYLFWRWEKQDFVPVFFKRGGWFARTSELVKRTATSKDNIYMTALQIIGIIGNGLIMLYFI
jgi:hypothetical protein